MRATDMQGVLEDRGMSLVTSVLPWTLLLLLGAVAAAELALLHRVKSRHRELWNELGETAPGNAPKNRYIRFLFYGWKGNGFRFLGDRGLNALDLAGKAMTVLFWVNLLLWFWLDPP